MDSIRGLAGHHMRTITSAARPVLLCGTDASGDARQIACRTVARAEWIAGAMMEPTDGLAGWNSWTIWHNDPTQDGQWREHSSGGIAAVAEVAA